MKAAMVLIALTATAQAYASTAQIRSLSCSGIDQGATSITYLGSGQLNILNVSLLGLPFDQAATISGALINDDRVTVKLKTSLTDSDLYLIFQTPSGDGKLIAQGGSQIQLHCESDVVAK